MHGVVPVLAYTHGSTWLYSTNHAYQYYRAHMVLRVRGMRLWHACVVLPVPTYAHASTDARVWYYQEERMLSVCVMVVG